MTYFYIGCQVLGLLDTNESGWQKHEKCIKNTTDFYTGF